MKCKIKKICTRVLTFLLVLSLCRIGQQQLHYARSEAASQAALALASQPTRPPREDPEEEIQPAPTEAEVSQPQWQVAPITDDPNMDILATMDIRALQTVNEDVIGWIWIPDTPINYPLLQGADNETYLHYTWDLQENPAGSIFLEQMNRADFADFHTIVYGHNMRDGSMFACIEDYADPDFLAQHPYIYIVLEDRVLRYEIFSTYMAETDSATYRLSFNQAQTRIDYLAMALENSVVDTGITPEVTDRIVTLSTCSGSTYATRWVVHGRLKMILT